MFLGQQIRTVALTALWVVGGGLPAFIPMTAGQVEGLLDPLGQLGGAPFEPEQWLTSLLERTEYTSEELDAIERIQIPLKLEVDYGNQSVERFRDELQRSRIKVLRRNQDANYVQRLVDQLHPLMARAKQYKKIQVFMVKSPSVMARAYPGGKIFVYEGLLELSPSEAALVAVLGHELSHIDRGHQLFDLKRTEWVRQSMTSSDFSLKDLVSSSPFLAKSFVRPFRPEEESVADRDGATWAFKLGYDPHELAALFQKMQQREERERQRQGPRFADIPFFRTHPSSEIRFQTISRLADQLTAGEPSPWLYRGEANLRQRETRQQKAHPSELFQR